MRPGVGRLMVLLVFSFASAGVASCSSTVTPTPTSPTATTLVATRTPLATAGVANTPTIASTTPTDGTQPTASVTATETTASPTPTPFRPGVKPALRSAPATDVVGLEIQDWEPLARWSYGVGWSIELPQQGEWTLKQDSRTGFGPFVTAGLVFAPDRAANLAVVVVTLTPAADPDSSRLSCAELIDTGVPDGSRLNSIGVLDFGAQKAELHRYSIAVPGSESSVGITFCVAVGESSYFLTGIVTDPQREADLRKLIESFRIDE